VSGVETWTALATAVERLPVEELAARRWFGSAARPTGPLTLVEGFDLGDGHALVIVEVDLDGGRDTYLLAMTREGAAYREAHEGDGAWHALAVAIAEGRAVGALPRPPAAGPAANGRAPDAALVCRPASALADLAPGGAPTVAGLGERPLGRDQSNTSIVIGDHLLLKAFRRLEPGLNPDLEMLAYLSEEAGFEAVPRLAGFVEMVSRAGLTTLAMLVEYLPDGEDAYESTAERLADWFAAPGAVALEFATEEAAQLGRLTAGLHATLAAARVEGFEPRAATRDELRAWRRVAGGQLARAIDAVDGPLRDELREAAPRIVERFTIYEALAAPPVLTRIHGDLHLGQLLRLPDGWVILDFEGEPTRPIEDRRQLGSPLRDVASMLRSIDHVGRSAVRRSAGLQDADATAPGVGSRDPSADEPRSGALDPDAWLRRARERFLAAYAAGLVEGGAPIELDEDLLLAFELEKECYEFTYAAAYLPGWMWAPTEGMRGLLAALGTGP
jgi:maltokinase